MMDNARPPRITANAGTRLAGASSLANVIIFTSEQTLKPIKRVTTLPLMLSSFTQYHWIKLSLIVQDSSLLTMSGPCLSSSVAVDSLKTAKDHRLGRPLPHQLPNPT